MGAYELDEAGPPTIVNRYDQPILVAPDVEDDSTGLQDAG